MYRRRTPASRFAQAERKAQAERDAGIPDREPDQRVTWWIDLRPIGGPWWRCVPRVGHVSYIAYAEPSGERVMCSPPKTILASAGALIGRSVPMIDAECADGDGVAAERERAAALVETLTYRARWISAGSNGRPVDPCELAAAIRVGA